MPCFMACLLEGVVMEASVVAMVVLDFDSVFCCILLEGELGSKCFVGSIVKLEVDNWRWLKWSTKMAAHL